MIPMSDSEGLRQYRPDLRHHEPSGWLTRLLDWFHDWKAQR